MTLSPKIDLKPHHYKIVMDIIKKNIPDKRVYVIGSRIKGCAKPWSDLDLLIEDDQSLPLEVWGALMDDFGESNLPWKVDIVERARLHPDDVGYMTRLKEQIYP